MAFTLLLCVMISLFESHESHKPEVNRCLPLDDEQEGGCRLLLPLVVVSATANTSNETKPKEYSQTQKDNTEAQSRRKKS